MREVSDMGGIAVQQEIGTSGWKDYEPAPEEKALYDKLVGFNLETRDRKSVVFQG